MLMYELVVPRVQERHVDTVQRLVETNSQWLVAWGHSLVFLDSRNGFRAGWDVSEPHGGVTWDVEVRAMCSM